MTYYVPSNIRARCESILEDVSNASGFTVAELTSRHRHFAFKEHRAAAAHRMRSEGVSLEAIASVMKRHHATVIYWLKTTTHAAVGGEE